MSQNTVFIINENGQCEARHGPRPNLGPRDLLLRTETAGLLPASQLPSLKTATSLPGHGVVGVVVEVGPGVSALRVNDRVYCSNTLPYDRDDHSGLAPRNPQRMRQSLLDPGAVSQFVRVPEAQLSARAFYKLPATVSSVEAAILDFIAEACEVVRVATMQPALAQNPAQSSLLILGLNTVSALVAAILLRRGFNVVIYEPEANRRSAYAAISTTKGLAIKGRESIGQLARATQTGAFACVVVSRLSSEFLSLAADNIQSLGQILVAGLQPEYSGKWPMTEFARRLIQISFCHGFSGQSLTAACNILKFGELAEFRQALPLRWIKRHEVGVFFNSGAKSSLTAIALMNSS